MSSEGSEQPPGNQWEDMLFFASDLEQNPANQAEPPPDRFKRLAIVQAEEKIQQDYEQSLLLKSSIKKKAASPTISDTSGMSLQQAMANTIQMQNILIKKHQIYAKSFSPAFDMIDMTPSVSRLHHKPSESMLFLNDTQSRIGNNPGDKSSVMGRHTKKDIDFAQQYIKDNFGFDIDNINDLVIPSETNPFEATNDDNTVQRASKVVPVFNFQPQEHKRESFGHLEKRELTESHR